MKKIISILLSIVMLATLISGFDFSAYADSINTPQNPINIGLGTVSQTFKYGYPTHDYNSDHLWDTEVYYKFVAPTTDYYEFSATGYENTAYKQGEMASVGISIRDAYGNYVDGIYTDKYTYVTKVACMLTAGQTYIVDLEDYLGYTLSYDSYDCGYAEQTIYLTVSAHAHDFKIDVYNYDDGSYYTSYSCNYCDYYTSIYTPAPKSNENSYVYTSTTTGSTSKIVKNPSKTSISKLTAKKKGFTVKWKKPTNASGYQIQYATDKNFKKNKKTVTVNKSSSTSKTVSKLKSKKKYYVRVRTYVTVNGTKKYSSWSAVKSIKTK